MIAFESAVQLAARIRNKEISSRELTELYIERIEKYDDQINAVVVRTFSDALAASERQTPLWREANPSAPCTAFR